MGSSLTGLGLIDPFDSPTKSGPIVIKFRLGRCSDWWPDIGEIYILDPPSIWTNHRWRDIFALALWHRTW